MSGSGVKDGDTIKMHYTGKLTDGSVFDSSVGGEPLEFTVGAGEIIPGLDQAVIGMQVGQRKTVTVNAEDAYGQRRDDLVIKVDRQDLPPQIDPVAGMLLQMRTGSGRYIPVKIADVTAEQVTIDANHPLAGQGLTFEVEIVEIAEIV